MLLLSALAFTLLGTGTFPVAAQITHASQGQLDENALSALGKAAKKMERVRCTVTRSVLDSQKRETARHTAEVRYSKGQYRIAFSDQELISDGKTVWHWNKGANEVTVSAVGDDDMDLLNPAKLVANHQKNFKAKYIRTEDDGTVVVDMQPRSAQSYHKLRLLIDEKSGALKRIEMHKYDSSREIYTFSGHKYNLPGGDFTFDPKAHPGVEIIDMR